MGADPEARVVSPADPSWKREAVRRILDSLRGSYNEQGIERWFMRPRRQLDGRAPAEVIRAAASPEELRLVTELAESARG